MFSITVSFYSSENFLGRFSNAPEVVVSSVSSPGTDRSDLTTKLLVDGLGVVWGVVSRVVSSEVFVATNSLCKRQRSEQRLEDVRE